MLTLGINAVATTIEVDADGGAAVKFDNVATNAQTLAVGTDNGGNSLVITNGGSVTAGSTSIGSTSYGDNLLRVAGSNSYLQTRSSLNIGTASGSEGNRLQVEDNGWVFVGDINTNLPAGSGISVGTTNGTATFTIGSGSEIAANNLLIGSQSNAVGTVNLSGADSSLSLSGNLLLGTASSSNTLSVGNGSTLTIGNDLLIGSTLTAGNQLTITNGGSAVILGTTAINNATSNSVNVKSGGQLTMEQGLDLDDETNGFNIDAGASLELGGTVAADTMNYGLNVTITGPGSTWSTTTNNLYIGLNADNNSLRLQEGASITNGAGQKLYVGRDSSSNELTLSGTNSALVVQNAETIVGATGSQNVLTVESNAVAHFTGAVKVGNTTSAEDNAINVDSGGQLMADGNITVGVKGSGNQFDIDGGQVTVGGNFILGDNSNNNKFTAKDSVVDVANNFILGNTADADGITYSYANTANRATVGTNTTMNIHQDLTVGKAGNGNTFSISDGGVVTVDGDAIIGEASDDNYIFLTPGNTNNLLKVGGDLVIGVNGKDNRFSIYGGTANITGNVLLGTSTNLYDQPNYIHLQSNAVLNVANAINVGTSNSLNVIRVAAGATANTHDLFVGATDGVSNNTVTISGEYYDPTTGTWGSYAADSLVNVTNSLVIGNTNGVNNSVIVRNGGTLQVEQENIDMEGINNVLQILDGGTLKTGNWDFSQLTGSATNILIESGATLHLLGELSGTNMVEGGLNFVLDGANASWNTGTNDMYVGYASDHNSLVVTNGAWAATSNNLFIGSGSTDNAVIIAGDGSSLHIGSDLYIGSETNGPTYFYDPFPNISFTLPNNTVEVLDGATLNVDNDAFLYNGAVLKIGSASQVRVAGNYTQDTYSTLGIGISSNQVQPNLVVGGTAAFANSFSTNYPLLRVYNEGIGKSNVVTIVQAGNITVDGMNATAGSIEANIATNLLLGFDVSLSNDLANTYIVLDNFISHTFGQAGNLDGQLLEVANAIESQTNNPSNFEAMQKIIEGMSDSREIYNAFDNYYGEKMSSAPAHNVINMGLQSVAEQLTKRADNTRTRMGAASTETGAPTGAQGPHLEDQELQGWITGFRTRADRSADSGFDGYNGNVNGILIGADLAVADGILFGVAGGSANSTMDKDNGASTDTSTKIASVYASAGTIDWFADASLIYGSSSVDSSLGTVFDTKAKYDTQNVAIYFGGGKEIIGNYLVITPQASLLGNYYSQDSYTETSTTALPRKVDSFDNFYLQSAIGCNVGFYTAMGDMILKPELRAFWLHEFNAREEDLNYSVVGLAGTYNLQMQAPESDIIKIGGGLAAKVGEYMELRADLDARVASGYSDYTLFGSIRYQF